MDNTKIKIKEAAAEQKMEPMEFLSLLRKWEIVTDKRKGAGGTISQDEYEKFKAKRKEAEAPQRVKVRRNNRNAVPEAPRAEARPAETPEEPQAAQQQALQAEPQQQAGARVADLLLRGHAADVVYHLGLVHLWHLEDPGMGEEAFAVRQEGADLLTGVLALEEESGRIGELAEAYIYRYTEAEPEAVPAQ